MRPPERAPIPADRGAAIRDRALRLCRSRPTRNTTPPGRAAGSRSSALHTPRSGRSGTADSPAPSLGASKDKDRPLLHAIFGIPRSLLFPDVNNLTDVIG